MSNNRFDVQLLHWNIAHSPRDTAFSLAVELSAQQANCLNCEQNKRIIAMCYCRRCMPRIHMNVSLQGQRASASHRSCWQANKQLADSIKPTANSANAECCNSRALHLSLCPYFRLLVACFNFWQCNNAIRNWQWKLLRLWHWPCANSLRHKRKAQPRMAGRQAGSIDKLRERK